jgi:hypothetical protein
MPPLAERLHRLLMSANLGVSNAQPDSVKKANWQREAEARFGGHTFGSRLFDCTPA